MAIIKAQKVPKKVDSAEDILARFCYYYKQYTLNQAKGMPYKRITQMLKVADREQATFLANLTNVVASPHTKKGSGVKKMLEYFKGIIDN